MKSFLFTFFLWLILFLGGTAVICTFNAQYLQKWIQLAPEPSPNLLFLGDSHAQTAIHPEVFTNALNMAQSSEELVFSYYKLKYMLRVCPELDTVVVSLAYHTLLAYEDKTPGFADESMMRYSLILEDYAEISEWNHLKIFWIHFLYWKLGLPNKYIWDYSMKAFRNQLDFDNAPYRGGGVIHQDAHLDAADINEVIKRHFFSPNDEVLRLSRMQLYYLIRMIQLCQDHQVNLRFYNSPVSRSYADNMPIQYSRWLHAVYRYLDKQQGVKVYNLASAIQNDEWFYDHDHVNASGSLAFSEILKDTITFSSLEVIPSVVTP